MLGHTQIILERASGFHHPMRGVPFLFLISLLVLVNLPACSPSGTDDSQGIFKIDDVFEEFYDDLGGIEILGPGISEAFPDNNLIMQYVPAGLMIYDERSEERPFYFDPIGIRLGVYDPPEANPVDGDILFIEGHVIFPNFEYLYEQLGGTDVVGNPINEISINEERNRIEQYFENLGFYQITGDNEVHLLDYGVFACGYGCDFNPSLDGSVESRKVLPEPFHSTVRNLGTTFVGKLLSGPYETMDGNIEVIFEHIVLAFEPSAPSTLIVRPIMKEIGIEPCPPIKRLDDQVVVFFETEEGKGYNVLIHFYDYIAQHGGMEFSGFPICEIDRDEDTGIYSQCFENICLEFHIYASPFIQVRPFKIGPLYKAVVNTQEEPSTQIAQSYQVKVWEEHDQVTCEQAQTIYVSVFQNETPIAGLEPVLTLTLPDGNERVYVLPRTGYSGHTQIKLSPIVAKNSTVIPYRVCVEDSEIGKACSDGGYLIWDESP
jgi:hypothetical protein